MYAPPQSKPFCNFTSYWTTRGLSFGSTGSGKRVEMAWCAALDSAGCQHCIETRDQQKERRPGRCDLELGQVKMEEVIQ